MLNIKRLKQIEDFNTAPGQELAWLAVAEELDLGNSNISGEDLAQITNHTPNLKKLNLYNCKKLNPLPEILNRLDKLEELCLDTSNISGEGLVKIINRTPSLKKLDLASCKNLNPLPEILARLDKLEELNLSSSYISGDDLVKIINHAPNIKKINLYGYKYLNPLPETLNRLDKLNELNVATTGSPGMLIAAIAYHAVVDIGRLSPYKLIQQNMPLWVKIILAGKYAECEKLLQTQTMHKDDYNFLIACSHLNYRDTDYPRPPYDTLLHYISSLSTKNPAF